MKVRLIFCFLSFSTILITSDKIRANTNSVTSTPFYRSSDKFPSNPTGIRIIGKFKAWSGIDGKLYLESDTSSGERNNGRHFFVSNVQLQPDYPYIFDENKWLEVISSGFLGYYKVKIVEVPRSLPVINDATFSGGRLTSIGPVLAAPQSSIIPSPATSGETEVGALTFFILFLILLFIPLYYLPTIIVLFRKPRYAFVMFILNTFFGVTGVGWIILFVVSVFPQEKK
jgi:hypothetical protein